ncbi:MAG: N-acetyltransferase family protein [Phycisphaerales bacterium]
MTPTTPHTPPASAAPAIRIRSATRGDVGLILSLIRALAEYEEEPNAVVATESLLEHHLFGDGLGRGPAAECAIGELDGRPEGFALWFHNFSTWLGRPGLYLEDLFVRPAARGRGLGKALFLYVARVAAERGCRHMQWMVLDWNEPAIGFYRSLGAEALSKWTVYRLAGDALGRAAASPTTDRPTATG